MKIVHVIAGAEVGGAETFAQDAILALHERGVAQTVLARPWLRVMERYREAGVAAEPAQFTRGNLLLGGRIRRLAARTGADLVHAWMQRAGGFVPAQMPCPVLGWFGDYYNLKYFRTSDCFVAVTPDITRHIAAAGMPAERCFTVNTFGTMPDTPPVTRESLGTRAGVPLLLVLSRMHRVKGIDTMLQALALLPRAHLWLAGDGPARGEYEQLAARLGLGERVRFLGWRNDRKALLDACDICVLPSRYEPFGTVIAEAWAMRRPLVATAAAGARQYVSDGVNGLLCPIEDAAALAAALRRAIDDAALRAALVAGGTAAYEADFTREVVIDRLLACYRRCVELGRRR